MSESKSQSMQLDVFMLRRLFQHLQQWQALREDTGQDVIGPYHLIDIQHLYEVSQTCLTLQQSRAINLFLVIGMKEKDAAVLMGVSATNPIGMYATDGLRKIIDMVDSGEI